MKSSFTIALTLCGSLMGAVAAEPVRLVPAPKQVSWDSGAPLTLAKGSVAVVCRDQATPAELAAADLLHRWVEKRFRQDWPVLKANGDLAKYKITVVVGGKPAEIGEKTEGSDGYSIQFVADGDRTQIVLAGVNGRGVTYAADTLFQLLQPAGEQVQVVRASIRDWASIAWRGRPMTDVTHYLEPGTWDGLVSSRMNWIDLRNGTYAFEPDYKFTDEDKKNIAEVIAEAHKREILVYGAVNVGVPTKLYPAVLEQFKRFIEFGVDGLWISFDDKGPGDRPEQVTQDILKLGSEHGMSGSRIATTPPKGSYQTVTDGFNRKIVAVPGMEQALWFWTPLPSEQFLTDAQSIGMKAKPSWWHNWPRCGGGFTHLRGGSQNRELKRTYVEIPALEVGWHEPSYEMIADAAKYVLAVVPWSGNGIAKEYVAPTFGWWSWSPEQHDWSAVRARIFDTVYGPEQVATMMEFEDTLVRAKSLFTYAYNPGPWRPNCPARLKRLEDRAAALELLGKCEGLAGKVAAGFAKSTLIDPQMVEQSFVRPLQEEIRVGKVCAVMDYPEYWWDAYQRKILDAVHAGDLAGADSVIASVRPKLNASIEQIGRDLSSLTMTEKYVAFWTKTAGMSAAQWKSMLDDRQAVLKKRLWDYGYFSVVLDRLLPNLLSPPTGWGRGGAERQMRVLATALPEVREQFWGDYIAGIYQEGKQQAAVFAMEPDAAGRAGDYAEMPVRLPVSGNRNRLGLLIFMNRWQKEKLGNEEVAGRWAGYSAVQLLDGDKVLWEGDTGLPRAGCEWSLVSLPPVPADAKQLDLRLRVIDKRDSNGMRSIVFVGPIRLVQMPD